MEECTWYFIGKEVFHKELLLIALKGKMLKYVNHLMTQGGYPKWLKGVEITYTKGNCVIAH